ncbi:hypothetical protein GCM10020219_074500 [Nonomuraea dietziae]
MLGADGTAVRTAGPGRGGWTWCAATMLRFCLLVTPRSSPHATIRAESPECATAEPWMDGVRAVAFAGGSARGKGRLLRGAIQGDYRMIFLYRS